MRLYLSHPSSRKEEIKKIQKRIEECGVKLVNPFDYEFKAKYYDSGEARFCVKRDLKMIDICDGILAFMDNKDIKCGTCMEVFYAWTTGKLVFVITKDMETHPWIMNCSDNIYKDYKGFIKWMKKK